jgi:hypothetical protein
MDSGKQKLKLEENIAAVRFAEGIARLSVESSGSRVTHFTTPSCV